jgi:hypothetical protein
VLPSRFFLTLSVNILSEILINSEIIPKCHKLFEARRNRYRKCEDCRGHHMVIIQTYFEKKIFIIVPKRTRRNKNKGKELRTKGWKNKKGITGATEDGILAFLDMKLSV